jgi:6-pyruvoyltetrahydropterin/6-carboxytetrahydropterin synthase
MIGNVMALGTFPTVITASRYHDFSYGHVVLNHESKCANMHGHNGRVHFTVASVQIDAVGRVMDFSAIKHCLVNWVEAEWDHRFLIHQDHPWAQLLSANDPSVVIVPFNPTAENLAAYLLHIIGPQVLPEGMVLTDVRFEETRKCEATAALTLGQRLAFGGQPQGMGFPTERAFKLQETGELPVEASASSTLPGLGS